MNVIRANIWTYWPEHWIVIPTNIGWKKNGENVMGRGLAAQAAERFPLLAKDFGRWCQTWKEHTPTIGLPEFRVICFPVKPIASDPALSWQGKATTWLIEKSAGELRKLMEDYLANPKVAMPMVGCGNGGLKREEVLPILERHLGDLPNLVLVDQS